GASALLGVADALTLAGTDGAGLLEIPAGSNGRGLREAGVLPNAGPGLAEPASIGRATHEIAAGLAAGELNAVYLLHSDPLRDLPDRPAWELALERASTVIAHASFLTESIRAHASVVFPAESYAEKEGTITHPDGRIQRLRPAVSHVGSTRAEWQVLAELAQRLGLDLGILAGPLATAQLVDAIPFYGGLTLDELAGHGVRWQERAQAAAYPAAGGATTAGSSSDAPAATREPAGSAPGGGASATPAAPDADRALATDGALRLGTFRSIWASPEVEVSPALKFLAARQQLEISPHDAERLGLRQGERVQVGSNGHRVHATVALRDAVRAGSVFLQEGTPEENVNLLVEQLVEVRPA
ncbi:MAG TPA: molybdopterin-dependent oxidoreductase, partial [Solirubrobacteraceae bacterium]|nr:molybdopterin-dependent oxidoreductase [Solirubrobacteraceae bacterium]